MVKSPSSCKPSHVGIGTKLAYASGNMGKSAIWASFESFLLFYLVTIAGMGPLAAGFVLMTAMVWDGLADLAVAWWSDTRGRQDILGHLIVWGAPLCGAGFVTIFLVGTRQHMLAVLAILLCRLGYTLCDVGHNTLLVRVSHNANDAATVSGLRLIFSAAGGGLVGLTSAHILNIDDPLMRQSGFNAFALGVGLLYVATLMVAMVACRKLPQVASSSLGSARSCFAALRGNRAFRQVLLVIALQSCITPIFTRSLPFFGQIAQGDAAWGGRALTIITLAQAVSLPVWIAWSRVTSPSVLLVRAHQVMILAVILLLLMATSLGAYGPLILLGAAQGGMNMAIWAMLTASIVLPAGQRSIGEALPVGLFLAVLKCASGLGQAMFAGLLAFGHLKGAVQPNGHALQTLCMLLGWNALGSLSIIFAVKRGPAPALSVHSLR